MELDIAIHQWKDKFIKSGIYDSETVEEIFKSMFEVISYRQLRGLIIYGRSGMGKTHFVQKLVASAPKKIKSNYIDCQGDSFFSWQSAQKLRGILEIKEPNILALDGFQSLIKKEKTIAYPTFLEIVEFLKKPLSYSSSTLLLVVIPELDCLPGTLKIEGRLSRAIQIKLSEYSHRYNLVSHLLLDLPSVYIKQYLKLIVNSTYNFSPADLKLLIREIYFKTSKLFDDKLELEKKLKQILSSAVATTKRVNLTSSFLTSQPSPIDPCLEPFGNVYGLNGAVNMLKSQLLQPLKVFRTSAFYLNSQITIPRGLLLYGPSGCGKTLLIRNLAAALGANLLNVEAASLMSPLVGQTERNLQSIFKTAREDSPTVLCFDHLDRLAPPRGISESSNSLERVVTTFLTEMDGVGNPMILGTRVPKVVVVGVCHSLQELDPALLRPGRFDIKAEIKKPGLEERNEILKGIAGNVLSMDKIKELSEMSEGYTGADIMNLHREALLNTLRKANNFEDVNTIPFESYLKALSLTKIVK